MSNLFDIAPDEWLAAPVPPPAVRVPRPRRAVRPGLFSLRRHEDSRPAGGRFRWRDGETLADYTARTDDRRIRRDELPKDVRRVKGGAYQSRPWVGPGRAMNVNLGLYHPEDFDNDRDAAISAAARASREFKKKLAWPGTDIWEVIQVLQREKRFGLPIVPPHVLPPKVRRIATGYGVAGCEGSFMSVGEAWAVAKAMLGRYKPPALAGGT